MRLYYSPGDLFTNKTEFGVEKIPQFDCITCSYRRSPHHRRGDASRSKEQLIH